MLRSKPTRVALTEHDLCYHINSIFSRNDQLTKWHQQLTGSGSGYDEDHDEEGLFLGSDTFSLPETLFESECDEPQSQTLADNSPQETSGERTTSERIFSSHVRSFSVRFASPKLSPLNPDSGSHAAVRSERGLIAPQLYAIQSAGSAHSIPLALQLALLSSADWNHVRDVFTSQYNHPNPHSLLLPSPGLSQPTEVVLDASLASLLLSVTALPVRVSGRETAVRQSENTCKTPLPPHKLDHGIYKSLNVKPSPVTKPLAPASSHLPKLQLVRWKSSLSPEMKCASHAKSASADKGPHELGSSEVHTSTREAHGCLIEMTPNSSSAAHEVPSPEDPEPRPTNNQLSTPTEAVIKGSPDKYTKDVCHLACCDTVSRATQTDPDLASFMQHGSEDEPAGDLLNIPGREENIAPSETAEQLPQQPWQDPFISAMFPEPDAPAYDPTNQIRRGVQGYVNAPARRGRTARNEHGVLDHFVHPTLVDAAVFQEYVDRLIAELDRAP